MRFELRMQLLRKVCDQHLANLRKARVCTQRHNNCGDRGGGQEKAGEGEERSHGNVSRQGHDQAQGSNREMQDMFVGDVVSRFMAMERWVFAVVQSANWMLEEKR